MSSSRLLLLVVCAACVLAQEPVLYAQKPVVVNRGDDISMTCTILDAKPDMLLYWRKTQANNQTTQIGTNQYIEKRFNDTGRYFIQATAEGTTVYFTLNLKNIHPEDAGIYECYLPTTQLNAGRQNLVVLVPPGSVQLYSVLANDTSLVTATRYTDGQEVYFYEGETRHFRCSVNDTAPAADVKMWITDEDISHNFKKEEKLLITGDPARDAGLLRITYQTNLTTTLDTPVRVTYDHNTKHIICSAKVPYQNATQTHIKVVMKFKPKLECNNQVITRTYGPVTFRCRVKSDPPLEGIQWLWLEKTGVNRTVVPGQTRYLYTGKAEAGKTEDETWATFSIKRAYPQTFREYQLTARNHLGVTKQILRLTRDAKADERKSGSSVLTSSVLLLSLTALLSWHH